MRSALEEGAGHPEITQRTDALLCSINDRLGEILRWQTDGHSTAGVSYEPLEPTYLDDITRIRLQKAKEMPEIPRE